MALSAIKPTGVGTAFITPPDYLGGPGIEGELAQDPGNTNPPIIFEPGPELTNGECQVWIIASGGSKWGGSRVYVSLDGTTYGQIGFLASGAVQGYLTATFASGSDPDTTNTLSVDVTESLGQIVAGTTADADFELPTLAYVDGELVAFSAATLISAYNYDLGTYIRRGCYETTIDSHASATQFGWVQNPFSYTYPRTLIGNTVYFKFPAFNRLGAEVQDLADCVAYPYVLTGFGLESPYLIKVATKVANYTILKSDTGTHFDNTGATGDITLTLPAATARLFFGFLVAAPFYLKVQAAGSDVIEFGSVGATAAGGFVRSNAPYSFLLLESHGSGKWVSSSIVGAWTIDS